MSQVEPRFPLPAETIVDATTGERLCRFKGPLWLPLGSRIQFDNVPGFPQVHLDSERFPDGRADGIVTKVSLWGTQAPSRVVVLSVVLVLPGQALPDEFDALQKEIERWAGGDDPDR
jgi:hypothetical protein